MASKAADQRLNVVNKNSGRKQSQVEGDEKEATWQFVVAKEPPAIVQD